MILLLMLNIFKNSSSKRQDSSTICAEMENHDASREVNLVNHMLTLECCGDLQLTIELLVHLQ